MRKRLKKVVCFFLAVLLAMPVIGTTMPVEEVKADSSFDVSKYNLEWTTPSVKQDDSMPAGNGEVGLNLWMENERDLVFYISKVGAYADNSTTMKLGRVRMTFPEGTFTDNNFSQILDLSTGSIKIKSGVDEKEVSLEIWVDANAPVIHIEGSSAVEIPVSVAYELDWRTLTTLQEVPENHAATEDVLLDNGEDILTWYHRNANSTWKDEAQSRYITSEESLALDPVENLTFGGGIRAEGMTRTNANVLASDSQQDFDVKIDIYSDQPEKPQDFVDQLMAQIQETDSQDDEEEKQNHIAWWENYWNTSYIEITDGTFKAPQRYEGEEASIGYTLTQNYLLQRFVQGAAMRSEHLIPFNGSIFNVQNGGNYTVSSPDERKWDGLPIMWQNTRAPYWATLTSGDFELTKTLIDYLYKSLPIMKEGVKNRFGIEGAYLTEPMMPYGVPASPYMASHLTYHFAATVEIPLMMVRYYNFTGDTELFHEKILPVVEACMDFLNNFYDENDENGKMIIYPANTLESGIGATNPSSMVGPMTAILDELLALPEGSLNSAQLEKFTAMRNRMPEVPTRELEGVTFLAQEESREGFYHGVDSPELYPVWPSCLYTPTYDAEGIDVARQTFAARSKYWNLFNDTFRVDTTGGWNQSTIHAAKLGLPYEAAYLMTMCGLNCIDQFYYNGMPTDNGTIPARFPAFWGPYYDWIPDQCHGGNFANALQAMLLQYDSDNNIYLLAAWPEDWNVNFKLYGPRNTIVTGSYQDGQLNYSTNNGYDKIIDLSGYENRVINRVSVACADQNEVFKNRVTAGQYQQMPDGKYDEENMGQYTVTGSWLEKYGESLNHTTGTAYGWNNWGGVTLNQEKGKAYFHLIDYNGEVTIPNLLDTLSNPICLNNREIAVNLEQDTDGIRISMDVENIEDSLDIIICADVEITADPEKEAEYINNDNEDIQYSEGWTAEQTDGAYNEDVAVASDGAEFSYEFTGTGIEVLVSRGAEYGEFQITVDGIPVEAVSEYQESDETQRTAYAVHGLEEGKTHVIQGTAADGAKVNLDALLVYSSNTEILNDTDGRIQYSGPWTYEGNRPYGEYKQDIHLGNRNTEPVELSYEFYGTGIEAIFTKGGGFANVEFWVDDEEPQVVSLSSSSQVDFTSVFSVTDLEPGMHTLHARRQSGSLGYIAMDALRVIKENNAQPSPIESVQTLEDVSVAYGTSFEDLSLPEEAEVTLKDGRKKRVGVNWQEGSYDAASSGKYELVGELIDLPSSVLNPENVTVVITVQVGLNPEKENPWYVKLDDRDPQIKYEGQDWAALTYNGLYMGTQYQTTADGDYFEITFTGTGIQFITYRDTNRGNADFYIDGEFVKTADMQGSASAGYVAFEIQGLKPGTHTLKGVKKDGQYFSVDAFGIFNDEGNRYVTAVESLPQIGCELNGTVEGLLPQAVEVSVDDVEKAQLEVNWDVDSFDSSKEGIQRIQGELVIPEDSNLVNNSNLKAEVRVFVSESGLAYPGDIKLGLTATEGKCGETYEGQITAVGGTEPYTYTVYGLPDGLSVSADGKITGTPSAGGTYQVDVLAKDAAGVRAYQGFELTIDPNVIVEQVVVDPSQAELVKGENLQFTAKVEGQRIPSQKVSWEVTGKSELAEGTTITDEGLLTVAKDETNGSLTVTATAAADSSVSGQATVTLKEAGKYHLTVTNGNGSGDYTAKENVTAEAPATDANGRKFLRWESDELKGLDMTANPLQFVMPECNVTLTAVYESSEEITEVAVEPKEATVFKGDSLQFAAEVKGDGNPSQEVVWSLEAEQPLAEGTEITQDGMLYVAETEENEILTVQAVSAADNTVSGQAIVTVTEKPKYQLTVINGSGSGEYEPGAEVTVEANEAEPGWRFVRWKSVELKNLDLTVNPLKFEMPEGNVTLEAIYEEGQEPTTYPVTVTNGTGSGKYIPGAMVMAEANEAEPGWCFSHWESEVLADSGLDMNVNPLQFQMPEKEVVLTAVYEEIPTVTKVTVDPAETSLVKGGSQQFTAVVEGENQPAQDVVWKLQADQELAAGTGITPDGLLNVAADEKNDSILVIAESVEDSRVSGQAMVTLTEQPAAEYQLTVTGGSGSGMYAEGEQVTAEAPAVEGKKFLYWESDELKGPDMTANPLVFVMPGCNVSLTAVYEDEQVPEKHQVTVIGGSGGGSYIAGETVQITAEAAPEGQRFSHWQSDELQGLDMTANPLSFKMPDKDVTVKAVYVPKQDGPDGDQDKDDDPATPTQTPGNTDKPFGGNGQSGTTVTPKPGGSGDKTGSVNTGDSTQTAVWAVLLAGAGAGIVLLNRRRKAK